MRKIFAFLIIFCLIASNLVADYSRDKYGWKGLNPQPKYYKLPPLRRWKAPLKRPESADNIRKMKEGKPINEPWPPKEKE